MSIAGKGILFRRPLTLRVTRSRLPSGSSIRSFVHPFVRSASDKRVQQSRGVRTKRGATSNRRPRGSRCRCPRGGGEPERKGNGSSSKQQHRAMSNQQQQSSRKLAMRDSPNRRANSMELAVRVSAALLTLSFFLYLVSYFSLFNTLTRHTQRWTYARSLSLSFFWLSLFIAFSRSCFATQSFILLLSFSLSFSLVVSPRMFAFAPMFPRSLSVTLFSSLAWREYGGTTSSLPSLIPRVVPMSPFPPPAPSFATPSLYQLSPHTPRSPLRLMHAFSSLLVCA